MPPASSRRVAVLATDTWMIDPGISAREGSWIVGIGWQSGRICRLPMHC